MCVCVCVCVPCVCVCVCVRDVRARSVDCNICLKYSPVISSDCSTERDQRIVSFSNDFAYHFYLIRIRRH